VEESSKQVELESKASWKVYNCAHVKLVDIAQGSTLNNGTPLSQQYSIVT